MTKKDLASKILIIDSSFSKFSALLYIEEVAATLELAQYSLSQEQQYSSKPLNGVSCCILYVPIWK